MNLATRLNHLGRVFLTLLTLASAAAASEDFSNANRLYAAGDFAAATAAYQKQIESNGASAARLYNLGNCQFRSGDLGAAILSYERARLLSPRDPDLLANLALARKTATTFDAPTLTPPWLDSTVRGLSRNEWAWLTAAAALWIGAVCITLGIRGAFSRKRITLFCLPALVLASIGSTTLFLLRHDGQRAIVLTKGAAIRLSPFEKAETIGTPGAGRTVLLGETNGGYRHVRVPGTDLSGWMFEGEISPIIPRS